MKKPMAFHLIKTIVLIGTGLASLFVAICIIVFLTNSYDDTFFSGFRVGFLESLGYTSESFSSYALGKAIGMPLITIMANIALLIFMRPRKFVAFYIALSVMVLLSISSIVSFFITLFLLIVSVSNKDLKIYLRGNRNPIATLSH